MKFCFIVQGEGRGHLMQSVALQEILEDNGHEVIKVLLGRNPLKKPLNNLYPDRPAAARCSFLSPFFISSKNRKGINLGITFLVNTILIPVYLFESIRLALIIRKQKPDVVINFYDIIGGISFLFIGQDIRKFVISHHFFFEHQDFIWPENRKFERFLLLIHSQITSLAAHKKLALSFTPAEDIQKKKIYIIPPILRKKIRNAKTENNGHVHVYTLNSGYLGEIENWCKKNPSAQVKVFTDLGSDPVSDLPNLMLFSLKGEEFLQSLITCAVVVCTAGFETLAEAVYLGKPLHVIPSENHFEQYCNALDLVRAGLGTSNYNFVPHIDIFNEKTPENQEFKNWVNEADKIILSHLCSG